MVGINVVEMKIRCFRVRFAGHWQDVGRNSSLLREGNDRRAAIAAELVGRCDDAGPRRGNRHTVQLRQYRIRRGALTVAGTIFASTNLPLHLWFRAMYQLTQSKPGISGIELGRRLGVTQTTAWKMKHKLAQVMMGRDASKRLSGRVELDDAYLGGERSGGKRGRGTSGKTPFVAAVETPPRGKAGASEAASGHPLLEPLTVDFCQAEPRSGVRGRQRWSVGRSDECARSGARGRRGADLVA
jgi:hypothetical protein